jgi:23S rRNA (adenine-N6)-dimethyltransferase
VLRQCFPGVKVVHADAVDLRLPGRPFRVVASPPFSHTAELLRLLMARDSKLAAADLVLQQAVVRRYVSGGRAAGRFSLAAGLALPRQAFQPRPRVDCAVLTIRRRR